MIEFKKNVEEILPYSRKQYSDYYRDSSDGSINWQGVSFQFPDNIHGRKDVNFEEYVEVYSRLFRNVVLKLDTKSFWIVNHENNDVDWLPNSDDNLPHLRALFKQNNVPGTYRGAIVFSMDDLLEACVDLISYPYVVANKKGLLYKNLDISHSKLQIVIKVSGHLNIDFLSTDKEILREIVSENYSNPFIVKEYRGTSLGNINGG